MHRAAIIVKDAQQQYEGLRTSVGLLLAGMSVQMFVLHHEIEDMHDDFRENMTLMDQIGGKRYSNNSENAAKYGFTHLSMARAADKIRQADIIIPF
ncbi:MAG: hypothetical protein PVG51_01105 [Desulfosarcina sp.]